MNNAIIEQSRSIMSDKARSFRWAARFLSPEHHDDAAVVYAFCRLVDDTADEAPDLEQAFEGLASLEAQVDGEVEADPLMSVFLEVADRRGLELDCARELIAGVRSDLEPVRFADDVELLRYCYRVAGTVGLMMCAVLGVDDPDAWPFAVDLGVGMQLTNISRDVAEDAAMGRCYLPATRLAYHGVTQQEILDGRADRDAVSRVVGELVDMGDVYYASGDLGMRYIPPASRLAILVASRVYRAIGHKLRANGCDAFAGRTVVGLRGKSRESVAALAKFARPGILGVAPSRPHDARLHRPLQGLFGANA